MDFKIKKGASPAALAAIRNKRKAFEQEQQDFVLDLKNQMTSLTMKAPPATTTQHYPAIMQTGGSNLATGGIHPFNKMKQRKNMKAVELSPLEGR